MEHQRFEFTKEWLIQQIETLEKHRKLKIFYYELVIEDLIIHYQRDIKKYPGPNLIKQAALITFWIKKLKPISLCETTPQYINELFALCCASTVLGEPYYSTIPITSNRLVDIIHMFRYGFVSPRTLFLLYDLLYIRKTDVPLYRRKLIEETL